MEKGNKIILVIGIVAIMAGVFVTFEASSFQEKAVLTEGKVVYVLGTSYKIRYFTNDGAEIIYQGSKKTHGYREGNSVRAWYRSDKPNKIRFTDGKKEAKILFIIGISSIFLGIYPLFFKRKVNLAS
jgi:uncharacterized membrane protein HdeD (DUF308 family)